MTIEQIKDITKDLKVLLVEDDEKVLDITLKILGTFFPNIQTAIDGQDGLEKFKLNSHNLVITDISMPKMDGLEMIKAMREIDDTLDVVILSAMNEPKAIVESLKLGIDGYLFKPLSFNKFIEVMENVFHKEAIKSKLVSYDTNLNDEIQKRALELNKEIITDKITSIGTLSSLMLKLETIDNFKSPVVILLNIDNFKIYNQLYGVEAGDKILIKFANILKEYNKNRDYELFRINADEFVLLDTIEYMDIDKYEKDMEELFKLDTLIDIEGVDEPVDIEFTAGISFSSTQALKKANMALFEARKRGRNFIGFSYDIDYTKELQSNLFWKQEIKNALEQKRVIAFYQPIVNRDQQIVQYESLVRIKRYNDDDPVDILAPSDFLDISVMTKQYLMLTKYMIETTLKTMKDKNVSISINLTYQDIKNSDIYVNLKENIKKYHLEDKTEFDISNSVIFEILEHEGIDCYNSFVDFIKEFKDMGVKIALDDFGTGFSNFSHITGLNPDYIKLDGALIENIDKDKKAYDLVNAIVKFSKELGINTIAEHVHSKEIFDITYKLGIDKFQGYYFGEPSEDI